MRSQLFLQGLILFLAVGGVTSFGPLAKDGLNSMRDIFGDMMGAANSGMSDMGSMMSGGMNGLGSIINGLGGSFGGIFQQILGSWSSIMQQLMGGGGDIFGTLFGIFKSMIESFFSILGSLTGSSRLQVNHMIAETGTVFTSVMRLKLNPEKNVNKLKQEILAAQKILESKHAHKDAMIHALKTKAPEISTATQIAYTHATKEFQKHMKALNPDAQKGMQKMHAVMQKASFDIMGILGMLPNIMSTMMGAAGGMGNMFQTGMNLLTNLFNGFKMIFPI